MLTKYRFVLVLIAFVLEIYAYRSFKLIVKNKWGRRAYWLINIIAYAILIYLLSTFHIGEQNADRIQWITAMTMIFSFPKVIIIFFTLINDVISIIQRVLGNTDCSSFGKRKKIIASIAFSLAVLFSLISIDGIVFGKYRYYVKTVKIKLNNLPKNFKGYKIIQISDVHAGSFRNPEKINHAIDLINAQNPDLVLFTGDMINNYATEFQPFIEIFKKIKAKDGKYAVLGNHDYGDYGKWKNPEEKANNIPRLISLQEESGFKTLRNESITIEKNGEKIYLLGVDNWGLPPFPQFGDLNKALGGIPKESVKILMSHDPTHFDEEIKNQANNVQLTLSGHTHGMQFGIRTSFFQWSLVQYRYPKWGGLYTEKNKNLYVNTGFGVIGFPGRVGMDPEITLIELQ